MEINKGLKKILITLTFGLTCCITNKGFLTNTIPTQEIVNQIQIQNIVNKLPKRYKKKSILYTNLNELRGTMEIGFDDNRNGNTIPDEIGFFKRNKKGFWNLEYTYHDYNEDGWPDIATFGPPKKNIEFYIIKYLEKELK